MEVEGVARGGGLGSTMGSDFLAVAAGLRGETALLRELVAGWSRAPPTEPPIVNSFCSTGGQKVFAGLKAAMAASSAARHSRLASARRLYLEAPSELVALAFGLVH